MSRKSNLAQNVKRLRKQLKLSQEELAKKAGITYSTLIKIESGMNRNPTLQTLQNLAEALGIRIDDLVRQ